MPGMPYHLEKGPVLSVLESFCNDDRGRLVQALTDLQNDVALEQIAPFDDPHLIRPDLPPPYQTAAQLRNHFFDHWLGKQTPGNPSASSPTGHWHGYTGPVERIMRTTLIRAAQVSLGIAGSTPKPGNATRHWPIDFWWKCPQPWFEGWVTWRRTGLDAREGHVTVVFATPADYGVVLDDPAKEATVDPQTNPLFMDDEQGSWLISSELHERVTVQRPNPGRKGETFMQTITCHDDLDVATFTPDPYSGGIDHVARFTPPVVP